MGVRAARGGRAVQACRALLPDAPLASAMVLPMVLAMLTLLIAPMGTRAAERTADDAPLVAALADGRLRLRSIHAAEGGALTFTLLDARNEPVDWSPGSCAAAFRAVRARRAPVTLGQPPLAVQLNWGWVGGPGGRALVDFEATLCEAARRDPPATVSHELRVLSLVGPVLTLARSASEAMAGGPPYHQTTWQTIDIRDGTPVDIRRVVEPVSLAAALRQDKVVRHLLGAEVGQAPLARMLNALMPDGQPLPFAIHRVDAANGRIAVRIAAAPESGCGLCINAPRQIGLWVQATPAFADAVRQGLLMHDAEARPRP